MRTTLFSLLGVFLLSGCILGGLEKTTTETRNEVTATKEGAQLATALEICLDSHISVSARVAACKPALLKLPEDRLADYMGIPMRIMAEESVRRSFETIELDLPNVLYVGDASQIDYRLELAPTSEDLYAVLRMATSQLISDVGLKAMKSGVTADEMATYRDYARRLVFLGTAVLGAVKIEPLKLGLDAFSKDVADKNIALMHLQTSANTLTGALPQVVPAAQRQHSAKQLRTMARNLSLSEPELRSLDSLLELRMRIR